MNTYLKYIGMTTALGVGLASAVLAQTPQLINYQTVVRNSSGELITDQNVGIELSILQGNASGNAVYSETHSVTTNDFGIVNLKLGGGTSNDDIMNIDWSGDSYFLAVGIDLNGGSSFTAMGTSELVSVPYALMAYQSQNDSVNDADADPNNELISSFQLNGTDLEITDAGGILTVDMSSFSEDADADPTNELQTISLTGNDLSLSDGGGIVSLGAYLDNTDAQTLSTTATGTDRNLVISGGNNVTISVADNDNSSTNEIQTLSSTVSGTNRTIAISGSNNITISVADNDNNATNEIQTLSLSGDQLSLSSGGGLVTFPYDSSYWQLNGDTIYTMDEHVAIGSNAAASKLYVYTDAATTNTSIQAEAKTAGLNRAIFGRALSTDANTNNHFGVVGVAAIADGEVTGGAGTQVGVSGEAYIQNTNATNMGVQANANGNGVNNYGVRAFSGSNASVRNYGGYFSTTGVSALYNIGVLSVANGTHAGINYAFYGSASNASINYAGVFVGDVTVTGTLTNPSDRSLKKDIKPYNGALNTIKQIGIYNYQYRTSEFNHLHLPSGAQIGFIAQDLEKVLPNLVSVQKAPTNAALDEDKTVASEEDSFTTFKGVNYIGMIPVLTQAINEQQALIEEQSKLIEALTNRIEALEK